MYGVNIMVQRKKERKKERKKMLWYGKCYSTSSSLPNIILVKFYIMVTICLTQKIVIKLVMSYERKKNHI